MATPAGIAWIERDIIDNLGDDVLGSEKSAAFLVAEYFADFRERKTSERRSKKVGFAGQFFDEIALSRLDEEITPGERDLTAVSHLSIRVDGEMYASLRAVTPQLGAALAEVDGLSRRSQIWDGNRDELFDAGGLQKALKILRELSDFGETTSRKLMSATFPHLLPIKDSVLEGVMAPTSGAGWWTSWRSVCGPELRSHLRRVHHEAASRNSRVPEDLSLLRVVDIAMWTAEHVKKQERAEGASAGG